MSVIVKAAATYRGNENVLTEAAVGAVEAVTIVSVGGETVSWVLNTLASSFITPLVLAYCLELLREERESAGFSHSFTSTAPFVLIS